MSDLNTRLLVHGIYDSMVHINDRLPTPRRRRWQDRLGVAAAVVFLAVLVAGSIIGARA